MKKYKFISTAERYKEAGCSEEALLDLYCLESRCEKLGVYLEEYRHIQPDGELFSESALKIISEQCSLHEYISELEDELFHLENGPIQKASLIFEEAQF
jgi:hypothetical protein